MWFMIDDFNKGFWMVELHPESRKLTTMALDIARFQWTRLLVCSIIAQDVFQWKLDAIVLSMPGVTGIADDMIIFRKTDQDQDGNLLNFLEVCRKNGLTLNPDKMQFWLSKVSFFIHTWWQRFITRPKENRSSEENGNPTGCRNNGKLPWFDKLPHLVQPMTSWIKRSTQMNMQTERGIPAYRSLWDCLSLLQGGNFQEYHPSLLQPQVTYNSTDRHIEERNWNHVTTKFH